MDLCSVNRVVKKVNVACSRLLVFCSWMWRKTTHFNEKPFKKFACHINKSSYGEMTRSYNSCSKMKRALWPNFVAKRIWMHTIIRVHFWAWNAKMTMLVPGSNGLEIQKSLKKSFGRWKGITKWSCSEVPFTIRYYSLYVLWLVRYCLLLYQLCLEYYRAVGTSIGYKRG